MRESERRQRNGLVSSDKTVIGCNRSFGRPNEAIWDNQWSNSGFTHELVEAVDPDGVAASDSLTGALGADRTDQSWGEAKARKGFLEGFCPDKAFSTDFHSVQ